MVRHSIYLIIIIGFLGSFTSLVYAQNTDRDVVVFHNGTKLFGTVIDDTSMDFVVFLAEDGVEYSLRRASIRMIIKESELGHFDFGEVPPEINLYINPGYIIDDGFGPSLGFNVGYLFPVRIYFGVSVGHSFGESRDGTLEVFNEDFTSFPFRFREQITSQSYAAQIELVRRIDRLRFRAYTGYGMIVVRSTIDYPDNDYHLYEAAVEQYPDWMVRDFRLVPLSGSKRINMIPLGFYIEYLLGRNIIFGVEGRYSFPISTERINRIVRGQHQTFIQEKQSDIFSLNMRFGYRILYPFYR